MNLTRGQVEGKSRSLRLQYTHSRPRQFNPDHPAFIDGRTLFPKSIDYAPFPPVLKPGDNSHKLGRRVHKGRWAGMPIFSLTLEERATCPRTCQQWKSCFGNGMPFTTRYAAGPRLNRAIAREVEALATRYPGGFVVRLHVLGDFYSVDYVNFWASLMSIYSELHVFGYTHWQLDTPIGDALDTCRRMCRDRFMIRHSDADDGFRSIVIDSEGENPVGAIICPVERGKSRDCGTCGLCWTTPKPISFIRH